MISCTEFIPAYSELFSYLEEKHGREEVDRFWKYLFAPTGSGIPLINYVRKEGIKGCFSYWAGTLNEEAADFKMYLNEKAGWFLLQMNQCPSKGRLLKLKDEIGIVPYHDYCLHCDSYRSAIEEVGLGYIYNFAGVDKASCSILIYEPKVFDGRVIINKETVVMDRKASQNEYFHPDFHSSMNMGIHYIGEHYGIEEVRAYLTRYTHNVYKNVQEDIKYRGLAALEAKIRDTYNREKSSHVLQTVLNGNKLLVKIAYCPAVKYLKATGREVSPWYRYTTEIVMETLAEMSGFAFEMQSYNEETGEAQYHFAKSGHPKNMIIQGIMM